MNRVQLRDEIAAEYVLGTLRGRARLRFRRLLDRDGELRRCVAEWEARLAPLDELAQPVEPPARVWRAIASRIGAAPARIRWWQGLSFWRSLAVASTAASLALGLYLLAVPRPEPAVDTVAILSDEGSRPVMVVSWPPQEAGGDYPLRVRMLEPLPRLPARASWQLWMLPGPGAAPIPLGLLGAHRAQLVRLEPEIAATIGRAWGMALSVEPEGGSPTGAPTGPMILKGRCVKVS